MTETPKYALLYAEEQHGWGPSQHRYFLFDDGYEFEGVTVTDLESAKSIVDAMRQSDKVSIVPFEVSTYEDMLADNKNSKYELVDSDTITERGQTLHRIRALQDFNDVKAGDLGGYIPNAEDLVYNHKLNGYTRSITHLDHENNAWVYDDAKITGVSCVMDNAQLCDNAIIGDKVSVVGNATVSGNAIVKGLVEVEDNAEISDNALIIGDLISIAGNAQIRDNAVLYEYSVVEGTAYVGGSAQIGGNVHLRNETVTDAVRISRQEDLDQFKTNLDTISLTDDVISLTDNDLENLTTDLSFTL